MMGIRSIATAACLYAGTLAPAQAWDSPLAENRKFIVTDEHFTANGHILDQACIMIELYYRMDEHEGLIYDPEAPEVVFEKVMFRNLSAKAADDSLARAKSKLAQYLFEMTAVAESEWTGEHRALRGFFPPAWTTGQIAASAARLVGKRGMRKSFRAGLEASMPYQDMIDSVFRAEGVPARLKYLAHVESRFNPRAVSPAGAAGMWQFLKTSGSLYLVIDDRVDQRFDSRASTIAAARYLKLCRKYLSSWPLAIMSYNNGPGAILGAVKETGSRDPSEIIKNYQAGSFGSISRNYYAMFLAASSLGMQYEALFPDLRKRAAPAYKTIKLEHEWTPRQLRILSGYSTAVIMRYNPALLPMVFDRNLAVPKGYELRLPAGLPSSQDLEFSDLRIAGESSGDETARPKSSIAGFPVPAFAETALQRVKRALFASRRRDDQPVMAYMHSHGLLNAERLASAKRDRILIEPHPALHAMIRNMGG